MPPPADGFAARLILGPALRTQPDRRLVALVRDGYETAFDEIVRRYGGPLRRYAATIVGGRSEDVTQDAFSKALLALRRGGAEIELRPWLFRIVRNTALNDLRDAPPSPEVLAEALAGGRNPAEELERREELAELIERLQSLPEPQRAAIVMRELEGLGHEEIAAALGLSGGGARQAIYRARQALRDGFGMLLPVPLLKALLSGSSSASVEAAAAGGAGGAGVALKAATATVLVAGAVGAGVAIDHGHRHERPASPGAGRLSADDPSRVVASGPRPDTAGDGSSAETGQGAGPGSPDDRHDAGGQRGSTQQDGGHGGREGPSTSPAEQGDVDRGGKDAVGPTNPGDEGGGSSGPNESPSSGDSAEGSSGPGGGSGSGGDGGGGDSSGPGDGTTAPTSDDEAPDTESSNSGPDSGDDGAGRSSGSDDQRDPHGATVFSVQETQP